MSQVHSKSGRDPITNSINWKVESSSNSKSASTCCIVIGWIRLEYQKFTTERNSTTRSINFNIWMQFDFNFWKKKTWFRQLTVCLLLAVLSVLPSLSPAESSHIPDRFPLLFDRFNSETNRNKKEKENKETNIGNEAVQQYSPLGHWRVVCFGNQTTKIELISIEFSYYFGLIFSVYIWYYMLLLSGQLFFLISTDEPNCFVEILP